MRVGAAAPHPKSALEGRAGCAYAFSLVPALTQPLEQMLNKLAEFEHTGTHMYFESSRQESYLPCR